ncbi:MAG: sugar phosphate isomerase/epimerase [Eubacterium sp.]|jgi:sugar phosphate isomerase/epimerase|nr:sugar phosphate isomerase/epimerase [Eubacterium sp.]
MNISIATATFYHIPFVEALNLIKRAGFETIELDTYWTGGENWEVTQHLKNIRPREVLKMVRESGLKINSLHDMGGVIFKDTDSVINSDTYEYLEFGEKDIPCIVFHAPHKKTEDKSWWSGYSKKAAEDLTSLKKKYIICIENIQKFPGYQTSLVDPAEMLEFVKENGLYINIDTTHYAQLGIDIVSTARACRDYVKGVHFSDYKAGRRHLFPGEGELDLKGFLHELRFDSIHAMTLECDIPYEEGNPQVSVESMKRAREYINGNISGMKGINLYGK